MKRLDLRATLVVAACMLSACTHEPLNSTIGPPHVISANPDLNSAHIVTFPVPPPGMITTHVAIGSDGNIWFSQNAPYIGRLMPGGAITEFAIPSGHVANDITPGAAGTLWFSEFRASKIGRITLDGTIKEFGGPKHLDFPGGVTLGSDGNVWFIDSRQCVGRMTTGGVFTLFGGCHTIVGDITSGPDGDVSVTDGNDVALVTPTGQFTDLVNPGGIDIVLTGIAAGPDGNLYVGERETYPVQGHWLTQVTPTGVYTRFKSPVRIWEISTGPDDSIWVTGVVGSFNCRRCTPVLSKFSLVTHKFSTPVDLPGKGAYAQDLTSAGDDVWFASGGGNYIGEYSTP